MQIGIENFLNRGALIIDVFIKNLKSQNHENENFILFDDIHRHWNGNPGIC